ncbi:MAG: 7-cyano-7-deazaguanine synthase QueC [Alphaproteobacteria bacterium]
MTVSKALVLFSGGQDSATCLAWALDRFDYVETIGFDYGQRHAIEMEVRGPLRDAVAIAMMDRAKGKLGVDIVLPAHVLGDVAQTALTHDVAIKAEEGGLPNTFVPGRNLLFLTLAAAYGWRRGIETLVGGMCETDYSGYPDCRDDTMKAMASALSLGLDQDVSIETPLMFITKAQIWALAERLGGERLIDVILEQSHTCYEGVRAKRHSWGYGCGTCPACELRAKGHAEWSAWNER